MEKKKPKKLSSKQRIALTDLDNENRAFQNECSKKIQTIEKAFNVEIFRVKNEMGDQVRPVRTQHEKDLKAAKKQYEQDKRNLEKRHEDRIDDLRIKKSSAMLGIENAYNLALREAEDKRDVAVEKVEATLQAFIKEDHQKRKVVTGE